MTQKNPVVVDGNYFAQIAAGDTIVVTSIPIDSKATNLIKVGPNNGLLAELTTDQVAAVFKDCEGHDQVAGASIPTCAEMNAAIQAGIGSIPKDNFLQNVQYHEDTHTLEFDMVTGGPYTVNLSDLLPVVVKADGGITGDGTISKPLALNITAAANPPASVAGTSLSTNVIGDRTVTQGGFDGWMEMMPGKAVPFMNVPTPPKK